MSLSPRVMGALAAITFGLSACTVVMAPNAGTPGNASPGGNSADAGSAPVAANVTAWWRAEKNAADQQGKAPGTFIVGANGTNGVDDATLTYVTANGSRWGTGRFGFAFALDGTDDAVNTPLKLDMSSTSPGLSYAAWVYPTLADEGRRQVISPDDGGYDWSLLHEQGRWHVFNGLTSVDTQARVDLKVWQHLAVTFDPKTGVRFYKNGKLAHQTAEIAPVETVHTLSLGTNPAFIEHFGGLIDEAQVYLRALSESEIATISKAP